MRAEVIARPNAEEGEGKVGDHEPAGVAGLFVPAEEQGSRQCRNRQRPIRGYNRPGTKPENIEPFLERDLLGEPPRIDEGSEPELLKYARTP